MPCPSRSTFLVAVLSCSIGAANLAQAQDPPPPEGKVQAPPKPMPPENPPKGDIAAPPKLEFKDEIKPLPPVAIPDDPPPHEGALIDIPLTVEPPDILVVEALEALPARPITGERLIRPDGTISLGFYGDVHVRGLTLEQVKLKVILHLRNFLNDEALGLIRFDGPVEIEIMPEDATLVPNPGRNPIERGEKMENPAKEAPPAKKPDAEVKPAGAKEGRPSARLSRRPGPGPRRMPRGMPISARAVPTFETQDPPRDQKPPVPDDKAVERFVVEEIRGEGKWVVVPPAESDRIFVDIVAYNAKVFYVQGDVGVPGRLSFTGKETVLDALNYAGGFIPTAEPADIHLYRPARGGKPAKDYKIDLDAIHRGVATANLQLFPNDRLVVGRNPIVKKTVELDRAASPINSVLNSLLQYSFSARALGAINTPPTAGGSGTNVRVNGQNMPLPPDVASMTPAQRDAFLKEWAEFLWSISSKEGGAMLDEKAFKEALMKKLTPPAEPAPK